MKKGQKSRDIASLINKFRKIVPEISDNVHNLKFTFLFLLKKSESQRYSKSSIIFSLKSFLIAKKGVRADPKYWLPPAPDQILNRLRLQLKNLGSDRLCNTA